MGLEEWTFCVKIQVSSWLAHWTVQLWCDRSKMKSLPSLQVEVSQSHRLGRHRLIPQLRECRHYRYRCHYR
jgi:hypothetical protein